MIQNMFHAFAEYKFLTLILAIAVVLAILVWVKALRASKKHSAEREAVLAKMREEKALRERYAHLTAERIQTSDAKEMLHGIALGIQSQLEKEDNVDMAFATLHEAQQFVYALNFVFCEDADTLSRFFRLNGKPLTAVALRAAREVFDETTLSLFERGYKMFDEEDETTSSLPDDVDALDRAFAAADKQALFENIRTYLAEHINNL